MNASTRGTWGLRALAVLLPLLLLPAHGLAWTESEDQPFADPDDSEDNGSADPDPIPWDLSSFTTAFPGRAKLVRGQLDAGDVDYYSVSVQAGQLLLAGITGAGERDDMVLGVFLAGSGSPDASDDDGGSGLQPRIAFPVPSTGTMRIAVSGFGDTAFTGAHDEGVAGLIPYELVIAVVDDPATRLEGDLVPGPQGANDTFSSADALGSSNVIVRGALELQDVDFFSLELEAGDLITAALFDLETGSLISPAGERNDPILAIVDSGGQVLGGGSDDDAGPGFMPHVALEVPSTGTWRIAVSGFGDDAFTGAHEEGSFPYALVVATDRACGSVVEVIASPLPQPASGNAYALAQLDGGDHFYTDRILAGQHVLVDVPEVMDCAQWIQTANDDKSVTDPAHLSFTLTETTRLYVGYDTRAISPPDWLTNDFVDTGLILDIFDPDPNQEFRVYRRDVVAGVVILGGNKAAGAVFPMGTSGSNYVVAATPFTAPGGRLELAGTAQGDGMVSVTIAGQTVTVFPILGQSAADVAADLAAAINADVNLQSLGVAALSSGPILEVTEPLENITITDSGIQQAGTPVPALPLPALLFAAVLLAALLARTHVTRRRLPFP